uniref:DOG1 domain-containing protein n=1 Tax=Leersia perrieri TaxID=77586 RepID=A0A0D9VDB0_9ORYZ
MGDRPWQQLQQPPPEQASCSTAGMMQAPATSSSIHGNNIIRKDPGGGYDMAELDHIFLYLNSQDQASAIQEQPLFPSQPMHAVEPSPNAALAAGSSKRPAAAAAAGQSSRLTPADQPPSASGKDGKAAAVVKAYIQNLETSRIRLSQLEQDLMQRSRTQAAWFDGEYARWVESHERMMAHLRAALEEQHGGATAEGQLRQLVDAAIAHHGVLVELKAAVASADVFHLVSGTWLPAAERCFLWIGGFRPSEIIKNNSTERI